MCDFRPMELKDTVEMMESPDFKERFRAEYLQLALRRGKLVYMLQRLREGTLPFKPACPESLLQKQVDIMSDYMIILEARAAIEKIDLGSTR